MPDCIFFFSKSFLLLYSSKENSLSDQCSSEGGLHHGRTQHYYVPHHSLSGGSWQLVNIFNPPSHLTFRFFYCACTVTLWSIGNVCLSTRNVGIHHLTLNFLLLPEYQTVTGTHVLSSMPSEDKALMLKKHCSFYSMRCIPSSSLVLYLFR